MRVVTAQRKVVAEAVGTALLASAVIGSGIMAQQLASDRAGALLANTIATGGALIAILLMFGPISGAHLNPAVTVCMAITKEVTPRLAAAYVGAQIAGGIAGAIVANAMFDRSLVTWSETARSGSAQLLSEGVAMFGLVGVVISVGRTRAPAAPLAVASYIVAAYWFTASTSFANPALTVARAFSNTFTGIRPEDIGGFIVAQAVGATLGALLFSWLVPRRGSTAVAADRASGHAAQISPSTRSRSG